MKRTIVRIILVTLLLLALGSAPLLADGTSIPPLCSPGQRCPNAL